MATLLVMSVFDSKVGAYAAPFLARTKGEAIRSFEVACSDDALPFKRHPADYRMFQLGVFDDNSGLLMPMEHPEPIIGADEVGK